MTRQNLLKLFLAFALVFLVGGNVAQAQVGGTFELRQHTVDGGGGASSGGTFALNGTIGQPDAGLVTGGTFSLNGGFWNNRGPKMLYLPIVTR